MSGVVGTLGENFWKWAFYNFSINYIVSKARMEQGTDSLPTDALPMSTLRTMRAVKFFDNF
jgi:hypothetical protein